MCSCFLSSSACGCCRDWSHRCCYCSTETSQLLLRWQVSRYSFFSLVWYLHFGRFLTSDMEVLRKANAIKGARIRSRKGDIIEAVLASIHLLRADCRDSREGPLPYMFFHSNGIVDLVFDPASLPPGRILLMIFDYCVMYYHDPARGLNITFVFHGRVMIGQHPIGEWIKGPCHHTLGKRICGFNNLQ